MKRELLTGARLDQALRWLKTHGHVLSDDDRQYIRQSATVRRLWRLLFALGTCVLIAVLVTLLWLRTNALESARTATENANKQREIAEARRIAAEATAERERGHPGLALLLAYAAQHYPGATPDVHATLGRLASRVSGVAIAGSEPGVPRLAISRSGWLAVCENTKVSIYRLKDAKPVFYRSLSIGAASENREACAFAGDLLVIHDSQLHLRAYDMVNSKLAADDDTKYQSYRVAGDGNAVVAVDADDKLHRWAVDRVGRDSGAVFEISLHDRVAGLSVLNHGGLAYGDANGTRIWSRDAAPETPSRVIKVPNGIVDPTLRWIVTTVENRLVLYNARERRIASVVLEDALACAPDVPFRPEFSADGNTVVVERCKMWSFSVSDKGLESPGVALAEFSGEMTHSPDGNFAVAPYSMRLLLRGMRPGCPSRTFGPTSGVRFTEDDDLFVFASDTNRVLYTTVSCGDENREADTELIGHDGAIQSSALSADKRVLVTGDNTGMVRVWNLVQSPRESTSELTLDELKALVGRNLTTDEWSHHKISLPYEKAFADLP